MKNKDIAIVGMSCLAPGATNIEEYWKNLINGVDSITDAPADKIDPVYFDSKAPAIDRFYCKRGGFIPDINFNSAPFSIPAETLVGMDPIHLMALKLVYQALDDANVFEKKIPLNTTALIIGKGNYIDPTSMRAVKVIHFGEEIAEAVKAALPNLSQEEVEKVKKAYQESKGCLNSDSMPALIPNLVASLVSNKLKMHGSAYTVDAACASSLIALEHAVKEIQSGKSDIAIAGGIHAGQHAPFWSIFNQLGAISHNGTIKPFSKDADGFLIGEAAGFVVLKSLEKAIADNDRIYALVKGVGVSSDGVGNDIMKPSAKGQEQAIRNAWQSADLKPEQLGYIEAHGMGTADGDRSELTSLFSVFPSKANLNKVLLGSVKSNIGHAMPAAGIMGLIKTALALYHRQIPPTLHCENPVKEMEDTRFMPVQKLEEWDKTKYPLVAGVNAFGFGGINAHAVLEAYKDNGKTTKEKKVKSKASPFIDGVVAVSAPSKEALIKKLQDRDFSFSYNLNENYRIIIFDATADRIEKAIKFVDKDNPWKGRQDIWFTNEPLLRNGAKVAFMYPGYDPNVNPEIEDIIDYFGLDITKTRIESNPLLNHSMVLYEGCDAMSSALNHLGVNSDMNLGHSLGEWFGCKASGVVTDASVRSLLASLDPEQYKIDGIFFIALGTGREAISDFLETIPDLYLANDNCPSQVLLCGTEDAINQLVPRLKDKQIFHQILPFQSGFHTPFIKDKMYLLEECIAKLSFNHQEIPIWSSNTLEVYPNNVSEFKELSIKHLLETVRFRELVEKLYHNENVRIFIQVGGGSLVGFVDDILGSSSYSAIATNIPARSAMEQLRRVLALLFIEGEEINLEFLNVISNQISSVPSSETKLDFRVPLQRDYSLLADLAQKYHSKQAIDISALSIDTNNPILAALNENIKEMAKMQVDMVKLFQKGRPSANFTSQNIGSQKAIKQDIAVKKSNIGKTFEEDVYVSLETHPTVFDHSLIRQPKNWHCPQDSNPVIPMTMTFELLAEAAHKQDLSKKILQLGPVSVFQWMEVSSPFHKKITGTWKSEDTISVNINSFASGEVILGDAYGIPPARFTETIDMGKDTVPFPSREDIYIKHMFHGPAYQGIEKVTNVSEKGIRAIIRRDKGKGSLLDNIGQLYALYSQLTLTENFVTFPVKVQKITFYQDMHDQDGVFECTCLSKSVTDDFTNADIIVKRDGKIWCIIEDWLNRRFELDAKLWQIILNPGSVTLSDEIAPNIFFYHNKNTKSYNWNFLMKRYLNLPEREYYESIPLNTRKDYLVSRVAIKDSLRTYTFRKYGKETFPAEYDIQHDKFNKPIVESSQKDLGKMEISIAHKGVNGVGVVSDKPVGIDIETIEDRTEEFMNISFTPKEKELIKGKDLAEWSTRFWVAKEAYGKMLGLGLQGDPKRYEIKSIIDDNHLLIEDCTVETIKYKNFIVGWTL